MIEHKTYFDGNVQSFAFTLPSGRRATSGVVLPGEYDFGKAEHEERIHVTLGVLWVNGEQYVAGLTAVVQKGGQINIVCKDGPASYTCTYW